MLRNSEGRRRAAPRRAALDASPSMGADAAIQAYMPYAYHDMSIRCHAMHRQPRPVAGSMIILKYDIISTEYCTERNVRRCDGLN